MKFEFIFKRFYNILVTTDTFTAAQWYMYFGYNDCISAPVAHTLGIVPNRPFSQWDFTFNSLTDDFQ